MKWLRELRQKLIRDIAAETVRYLGVNQGWEEFLPPVALRDCVYLVTKSGTIYRMCQDNMSGMEIITQIRNHL